ncbi:LAMI_0E01134g1_1 [Lachancea mirantina]|uniref:LAMI_0E01134g1_1 n=1 Tax=Lachancea mirantina TaxID=1230905 RepID=A0A1G4JJ82_9SACH|nr:LAMI_0E01134g1_1 [Lachancea mirantina]
MQTELRPEEPCTCANCVQTTKPKKQRRSVRYKFSFTKNLRVDRTNYREITSMSYLARKYGEKSAVNIRKFIKCIHRKINIGVSAINDEQIEQMWAWDKVKLFLLLVTLSQRGGPDYWIDRDGESKENLKPKNADPPVEKNEKRFYTLTEQIMRFNLNEDFNELIHDENYVLSSIWANFMEGLINHYLEKVIIPQSEMKVCQQLYKPMMKIISLYNEYNELMEKSERSGFLPPEDSDRSDLPDEHDGMAEGGKLKTAQRLLWQARQDIPKTISKELTLLSEMYSTLSTDEQDYELGEFVSSAEEYIEMEYLPSLTEVLFDNCSSNNFWKIMLVLEPFFYYIEDTGESTDCMKSQTTTSAPDPRVVTLEKICEVAARQEWA